MRRSIFLIRLTKWLSLLIGLISLCQISISLGWKRIIHLSRLEILKMLGSNKMYRIHHSVKLFRMTQFILRIMLQIQSMQPTLWPMPPIRSIPRSTWTNFISETSPSWCTITNHRAKRRLHKSSSISVEWPMIITGGQWYGSRIRGTYSSM